ncbi:MAG TPA: urease accessory protein UreD, partial [Pontiella sp.]
MKTSHLELEHIRERTRVTRMVSRAPLRLLETGLHSRGVEIQLSSYGGGVLQGDQVDLDIQCGAHTGLLLKSQANTHVYRNDTGKETIQRIVGRCAAHSSVRVFPEPLVLHSHARFSQYQSWDVSTNADLILADWMQSGRSESKERFAFSAFESNVLISIDGNPVLEEHFSCFPKERDSRNPARFGP